VNLVDNWHKTRRKENLNLDHPASFYGYVLDNRERKDYEAKYKEY